MAYNIKEETSKEVFFECLELGRKQYEEVEAKSSFLPYDPDYKMAEAFIDLSLLRLVTARKDGKLVGYFGVLVVKEFLTSQMAAKELGIFVDKEHRKSSCFYRMLKYVESMLIESGVSHFQIMFKTGHDTGLAYKAGFEKTETVYQKFLKEG